MSGSHSSVSPPHPLPRHVYVDVTGRWGSLAQVGIFLAWRRNRVGRWEALVVMAAGGGMTPAEFTVRWVAAEHVRPLRR